MGSHLLLKFYVNIDVKNCNSLTLIANMQLYILYFKFVAFKLNDFLCSNKIKIRKSNWLLFKYVQLYLPQINNTLNLFNVLINNKLNNLSKTKFNSMILKMTNELNLDQINSIQNVKLINNYLRVKLLTNKSYLSTISNVFSLDYKFTNHMNILRHSLNVHMSKNTSITSLKNNLLEISNKENFFRGDYHLSRNFLDLIKTKEIIRFNKDDKLKFITNYSKINN